MVSSDQIFPTQYIILESVQMTAKANRPKGKADGKTPEPPNLQLHLARLRNPADTSCPSYKEHGNLYLDRSFDDPFW